MLITSPQTRPCVILEQLVLLCWSWKVIEDPRTYSRIPNDPIYQAPYTNKIHLTMSALSISALSCPVVTLCKSALASEGFFMISTQAATTPRSSKFFWSLSRTRKPDRDETWRSKHTRLLYLQPSSRIEPNNTLRLYSIASESNDKFSQNPIFFVDASWNY